MNWVRILLWANGIMFVGYGLACLVAPSLPAESAGFALATASGTVEVMAMYGGLQLGFGGLLVVGARDSSRQDGVALALGIVLGSLAAARLIGMVLHGPSPYNLGAFGYESVTTLLVVIAVRSGAPAEKTS